MKCGLLARIARDNYCAALLKCHAFGAAELARAALEAIAYQVRDVLGLR